MEVFGNEKIKGSICKEKDPFVKKSMRKKLVYGSGRLHGKLENRKLMLRTSVEKMKFHFEGAMSMGVGDGEEVVICVVPHICMYFAIENLGLKLLHILSNYMIIGQCAFKLVT